MVVSFAETVFSAVLVSLRVSRRHASFCGEAGTGWLDPKFRQKFSITDK
jgi:hypothetical protein